MPRRTFWLVTGVAIGAGSSMWAERRVRRTLKAAAARMQPDSLVATAGRGAQRAGLAAGRRARTGAATAGTRVREAVAEGRRAMARREEELWAEVAAAPSRPAVARRVGQPAGAGLARTQR
ncbi:MAG TPA: hypothetical protein VKW77_10720 [Acidimicrobiales bacterium]|nr:hypothetical protein [Acidimicrobiales bacterium]